ncbi:MAG TPA: 1-acyl-sn-glycerol-3-phosphate acyltransferase [Nitrospirae bacterium]|nr:1-acyl-sn-glycerol-3-phosphate acyltransferase [Nitrospirota bacterium]
MDADGNIYKPPSFRDGTYRTSPKDIPLLSRIFPSLVFYPKTIFIVFRAACKAKYSRYDYVDWCKSSHGILNALEGVGIRVEITGTNHIREVDGPCVFVANHMSTLETFVLPVIVVPFKETTFAVKESLVRYPVFKHIMISRDPIVLTRTKPREDLVTLLREGTAKLKSGKSIIIFPQTTRRNYFDPKGFNSIGIKLARRAGVPVIPIALKTDAWGCGRILKDFGKVDPSKKVCFAFGEPIRIKDRGNEEHKIIMDFIAAKLQEWKQ